MAFAPCHNVVGHYIACNCPNDPDPDTSDAQVLRYKWEVYVIQVGGVDTASKQETAILMQKRCNTNGRCITIFLRVLRSGLM